MPFKGQKQRKWMWANEPEMAERWTKEEKRKRSQSKKSKKRTGKRRR